MPTVLLCLSQKETRLAFCVNRRDILVSPIREYSARVRGSTVVNSRTCSSYVPKSAVNNDARRMSSEKEQKKSLARIIILEILQRISVPRFDKSRQFAGICFYFCALCFSCVLYDKNSKEMTRVIDRIEIRRFVIYQSLFRRYTLLLTRSEQLLEFSIKICSFQMLDNDQLFQSIRCILHTLRTREGEKNDCNFTLSYAVKSQEKKLIIIDVYRAITTRSKRSGFLRIS